METGNISYNRNLDSSQVDKRVAYLNTPFEPRKAGIILCNLKTVYPKCWYYFLHYQL